MPDVSIAVSIRNQASREFQRMAGDARAFDKDLEMLGREVDTLNRKKVTIKTDLDGAKKELREARKGLDDTAASIERLQNAHLKVDSLQDDLRKISHASKQAQKDLAAADSQISKSRNGGGYGSPGFFSRLNQSDGGKTVGQAGRWKMRGDLAGEAAGAMVASAYGSQMGTLFHSGLSGAGSGAAIGSMIAPGIGTAIGAGVGALAGTASGAVQNFTQKDDAFKSFIQEQVETQIGKRKESLDNGISIAARREIDALSFTTLFDKNKEMAERYLNDVRSLANSTPFAYGDLVDLSKTLKAYGFEVGHMLPTLTKIGDAGATLGMGIDDMNAIATALGRMYVGGNATREELDILSDRSINSVQYLADAYGVEYGKMLEKISKGEVEGKQAVEIILTGMQNEYSGGMQQQGTTYSGLMSSLDDAYAELDAAQGNAFNKIAKSGLESQLDFFSSETGERMRDVYSEIGTYQAELQNTQMERYRDVMAGIFDGEISDNLEVATAKQVEELHARYTAAYETLHDDLATEKEKMVAKADLTTLMSEAEIIAEDEYLRSDGVNIMTDANISLAETAASNAEGAWSNAGYRLSQQLSRGLAFGLANIKVNVPGPSVGGSSEASTYVRGATNTGGAGYAANPNAHAFGLPRVPHDDYPALLHEGERVLTANQARQMDAAGVGNVVIQIQGMTVREDTDIDRIAAALAEQIRIAKAASKS